MEQNGSTIWSKNFTGLVLSNGFFFGGFHMLLPTVPLLASDMGGSKTQVGLIAGIFVLSSVITRLFTDLGVRKLGKRNCLLLGIVISLFSAALYPFAPTVETMLWVRVLHGVGFGIGTTFYVAIVSDVIPATRRGEGLGYFGLATTIAMAVAPATGLWIAKEYGFTAMFAMAGSWELIAGLLLSTCGFSSAPTSAPHPERHEAPAIGRRSVLDIFVEPGTLFPAFLVIMMGIAHGSVINFIAVYANELHLANPGYFFILGTGCIFLSRLAMGKVYDRKGPAWVVLPGVILLLTGLVTVAEASTMEVYLAAAVLHGFGIGMLFPALQTATISDVAPQRRSAASATFSNALDIGLGGGSVLLGMFAQKAGLPSAYLCAAAVMGVFLVIYTIHLMNQKGLLGTEPLPEEE
ncbi:MFS transporter [Telmatospirillum siberiense]|uniref:MFS transporter n=1 Tax=Telmatospirillum siberiense TaxID=382514 RepID=A0A2N3PNZ8_9PROT|nr:MFS transporter [Telmatospirillum siberiense]PKU22143.1 MFS transporter [Telmatospirillum siberiense]